MKKIIFGGLILSSLIFSVPALAQNSTDIADKIQLEKLKTSLEGHQILLEGDAEDAGRNLVELIFKIIIMVSGAVFMILLLIGGIQYMVSAGSEESVEKAKRLLLDAVIGLVITLSAYAIGSWVIGRLTGDSASTGGSSASAVATVECADNITNFSVSAQRVKDRDAYNTAPDPKSSSILIKLTNVGDLSETNYKHRVYIKGQGESLSLFKQPSDRVLYAFDARDGKVFYTAKVYDNSGKLCDGVVKKSDTVPAKQ